MVAVGTLGAECHEFGSGQQLNVDILSGCDLFLETMAPRLKRWIQARTV